MPLYFSFSFFLSFLKKYELLDGRGVQEGGETEVEESGVISGFASLSFQCLNYRTDLPVVKHWTSCCGLKINNIPVVPLEAA